jgi:hypothetical protein
MDAWVSPSGLGCGVELAEGVADGVRDGVMEIVRVGEGTVVEIV